MISIVCAYYNRKILFKQTLTSIKQQLSQIDVEIEVIAVDDGSDQEERLEDLVFEYPFLKVIRLEKKDKWYSNSCIPFNIGFKEVKGDIVIIQNPECLHYGNILKYTLEHLNDKNYLSFSCFSLGIESTENLNHYLESDAATQKLMNDNAVSYIGDGLDCWYNHSVISPKGYHFCCAIRTTNLFELGGFDERFARGIAFDDNEFLYRIKQKGLKVKIIDKPLVLHQNHYTKISYTTDPKLLDEETYKHRLALAEKNRLLFELVTKSPYTWKANNLIEIKTEKKEILNSVKKFFKKNNPFA